MIKATKENNLAVMRPDLAKEWHPTKNGDLTPYDVTCGSGKKVYWIQPYDDPNTGKHFDFVWKATVYERVNGTGCPVLSGKMAWPGFNDLATTHPDLAVEWHPTLNGDLTPYDVTFGSEKKVWWLLPYDDPKTGKHFDFVWESTIFSRKEGKGCPFLAGKAIWPGFNDLATTHPYLAKEWHPTKNGSLTPQDVSHGCIKAVWWCLPYDDPITGKHFDFEWQATVSSRTDGNGCPFLSGRAVWTGFNDLLTLYPELAREWHPIKNGGLTPDKVVCLSNNKVWWYLPYDDPITGKHFDFEWQAAICSRTDGNGCPFLSGRAVWIGFNDLATTHPELAKEWHPTKNGNLNPIDITGGSGKKVWWYLPYDDPLTGKHFDFEWQAIISNRVAGQNCPVLSGKMVWPGFNDLCTTHPDLAAEWHPTKNGKLTPQDVTYGSNKKVWWLKEYDGELKEWFMSIEDRAFFGSECPGVNSSKLEKNTSEIMKSNNILFQIESTFDDLVSDKGCRYRYDFYLHDRDLLIECDGIQHFQCSRHFDKYVDLEHRALSDNIKNDYALENNIALLRIPHIYSMPKKQKELEEIVLEFIKTKKVPQKILDFYAQFEFSNYVECVNKFQNQLEKTAA